MDLKRWRQKDFVLSTFEAIRGERGDFFKILTANKDAGINLVEIVFKKDRELISRILKACEEAGLNAIVQDPAFSGIGENYAITNDKIVKESLEYYSAYKSIYGYYIWDEPVEEAFSYCRDTKRRFERLCPEAFLHFCAFPSYGMYKWDSFAYNWIENTYPKYIDNFLRVVDPPVVTFDYYPFREPTAELLLSDLWRDMGYVSKRARELGKPFWFYFQGVDMQTGVGCISPYKIAAQMFAAIAHNAKGLSWFVTANVLTDLDGGKRPEYEEVKRINLEVLTLGKFFFDKQLEYIFHTPYKNEYDEVYFQDNMEKSTVIQSAPDYCVVSEFTKGNDTTRYLLIVNKQSSKTVEGKLELKRNSEISVFDKSLGILKSLGEKCSVHVALEPGDALALTIM